MNRAYCKAMVILAVGAAISLTMSQSDSATAIAQRGFQRPPGQVTMNRYCLDCHDLTQIRTRAFDLDGWSEVVDEMVEKGAAIESEEIPVLTAYLSETYGPLPDGEGKSILLNNCTICHNRDRIFEHAGADREHWETTLLSMLNEGAFLSDQEFTTILNYLVRNFGD